MGSKAIIAIAGVSGSGKTFTALMIARGMVSHPSKIGFLDTENKRGSLYSDILDGPFMIGDLYAPFTPTRYRDAIKEFQDVGVEVLVIDSITHEWEGEGGCDDIAQAPLLAGKYMANWIGAKREHKAFMNTLLQCNMNVICCIRARERTDFKNPSKPVSLGLQPICEKNFMYEMTASFLIEDEGRKQTFLKLPEFLKPAFGDGKNYITHETGSKIIEWVNGGGKEDREISRIKSEMQMACEGGLESLVTLWNSLKPAMQKALFDHKEVCKSSAMEYDRLNKQAAAEANEINQSDPETETYLSLFKDCKTLSELNNYGAGTKSEIAQKAYDKKYAELGGKDA